MAAKTVTIEQAEGNLEELIEKANAGDEVILEQGGQPVAKLVALPRKQPSEPLPPRTVGDFRGRIGWRMISTIHGGRILGLR